ncbi:PQQ-binding-like beta-propeller repeat protein [Phenylobacterium sp.]|jgi:glucose dehydrogenase|uniref:outer membrane protein assembly factor BamB family protein n=1 Tax=Phenylobacterium sp. TaxID=1871053 RepID=UPI003782E463
MSLLLRRPSSRLAPALAAATVLLAAASGAAAQTVDWPQYGGDAGFSRYSPANRITPRNVKGLKVLWTRSGLDADLTRKFPDLQAPKYFRSTPVVVGGVAYAPNAVGLAEAFDAVTGKTIWTQRPFSEARREVAGSAGRGLALWGKGKPRRVLIVRGAYLYALDAATGAADPKFGEGGRVSLTRAGGGRFSVSGGPAIAGDVVIVGGDGSADDNGDYGQSRRGIGESVRAYDVHTGALLWEFSPVPAVGDPARASWPADVVGTVGSMGSYGTIAYDAELGYAYFAFSAPAPPGLAGWRAGDNLYSNTLVCVDARTGRKIWHRQLVHHDVWDYDLSAPPVLGWAKVGGKRIKTVMQTGKMPLLFTFDRRTGEPVWPIEERPVPASALPGEALSPTQPVPTRPAPLDRVTVTESDLIDFTPALKAEALEIFRKYNPGVFYAPPSTVGLGGKLGVLVLPGTDGGGNWNTGAFDPKTGVYFGATITTVANYAAKPNADGSSAPAPNLFHVDGPQGLPLVKPPYGRITAVDMTSGSIRWVTPIGQGPTDHPALKGLGLGHLGIPARAAVAVTDSLVFAGQSSDAVNLAALQNGYAPKFNAYDKATGAMLVELDLPPGSGTTGAPVTYMVKGKQYVLVAVGGRNAPPQWVAFGL